MAVSPKKSNAGAEGMFRIKCENCGVELAASPEDSGKKATCPECGVSIIIPASENGAVNDARPTQRPAASPHTIKKMLSKLHLRARNSPDAAPSQLMPDSAPAPVRRSAPTLLNTERHKVRAKLAGWYRRVAIVVFALAVLKVFGAAVASLLVTTPGSLHGAVEWMQKGLVSIPTALTLLSEKRPMVVGSLTSLEHLILAIGMLIFATRMVIRTKLLDAIYVTSERWEERTETGLTLHFIALLVQAGVLGWAASCASINEASDGMVCGLIALQLLLSAAWLLTLHLVAGNEFPELNRWMIINAVSGMAILFVVMWPGVTVLWSRAGATAVLFLADSAAALHVGASFVFARRKRRWWWHKPLSIIASIVLVALVAIVLACVRPK